MIRITLDHSYEEDYFMISYITVEIDDVKEKERILNNFKKIDGGLVSPDNGLSKRIAEALGVDVKLIDIDTYEIDLM